jgi:hypothetical protein
VIGEGDPSLFRYGGLAVTGELAGRLQLVELIDAELSAERRARPVKVRRRGVSPGQLVVSFAESQLVGGEFSPIWKRSAPMRLAAGCEGWARRHHHRQGCSGPRTLGGCTASG